MEYKNLRPSQTLLDPQNPRLPDGTSNDREAINRLLAEGYNQLLALARDLCDRGEANPTELPIARKDGTKYVVFEGNRRFAALKLVDDPRLADNPAHQTAFQRLKDSGKKPPKTIYCAIAKSRDEVDPWLTLRHTGANDGVGVRTWSAEQTALHRRRMRAPIDSGTVRSIAIADELSEAYHEDTELVDLIKKVRASRLTNIGRLFSGVTLTRVQLQMKQAAEGGPQTLTARHNANQLHDYFVWAFKFLEAKSVDAFKNDNLRGDLLNNAAAALLPSAADSMPDHVRLADVPYSLEDDGSDGGVEETDGGKTDGGNSDGGRTDGGRTDGGRTDGGRTDGGETDGGETDGGETDGGETDGGETDGGGTDGGGTDGGGTDGGGTDGGETDDGKTDDGKTDDDSENDDPTDPTSGDDGNDGNDGNDAESKGHSGRQRDERPERTLYSSVKLSNLSKNIQRLLREVKALPIDDNYASACVLARVILELAVSDSKVLAWSGKKEGDKLAQKIRACIHKLDPDIDTPGRTRQDLVQANLETNEIGVVYLHQFMHNPSARADPHLARRFSEAYTPLLNSINEAVV